MPGERFHCPDEARGRHTGGAHAMCPDDSSARASEEGLEAELRRLNIECQAVTGYKSEKLHQWNQESGPKAAISRILAKDRPSRMFILSWAHRRLDLTIEGLVLKRRYSDVFSTEQVEVARKRLAAALRHPPRGKPENAVKNFPG